MAKKSKIEIYPKTVNGKRINYPSELGEDFLKISQDTSNRIYLKAEKNQ